MKTLRQPVIHCPAGSRNSKSRNSTPPPNGPHSPAGAPPGAAQKTGKAAKTVKEKAQQAGAYVMRHKKGFGIVLAIFLLVCLLLNTMSSCSMMAQSIGSAISGHHLPLR